MNPQVRYEKLVRLVKSLQGNEKAQAELDKWQTRFSEDVVKIEAKVMTENKIFFGENGQVEAGKGWTQHLRNAKHVSAVDLRDWAIFFMPRDEDKAHMVCSELRQIATPMGFRVHDAEIVRLQEGRAAGAFQNAIKQLLDRRKLRFIVCIVPNNAKDTYDAIKRLCCIDYSIPSQVITSNVLNNQKNVKSVMTKITIQINAKQGGEIWGIKIPVNIGKFLNSLFKIIFN